LITMPITVTVAGVGSQRTALGTFRFWDVATGGYHHPLVAGGQSANPNPATNGAGGAACCACGRDHAAPPVWTRDGGDGIRQP
ncbi:MAG: hypothetical protein IPJ94_16535, partial [Chloroflexi bacterium]|nr:hypothetical protein [Chloroflexota bacterium]